MKKIKSIVTVASWEERFIEGFKKNFNEYEVEEVIMFYYKGYEDWTIESRSEVKIICANKKVKLIDKPLDFFEPLYNWNTINQALNKNEYDTQEVLVDITTMPRDTIWTVLFFLEQKTNLINYVYFAPEKYNQEWISRDPAKPRLLYKLSGITKLGAPTLLFVTSGFDFQRLNNLIHYYEPQKVLIGVNSGDEGKGTVSNYLKRLQEKEHVEIFTIETLKNDLGYERMESYVKKYNPHYNIIFSSLGPKPSALSIYRLCRAYPEVGLIYIPCREFNQNYSSGIGTKITGKIEIPVLEDFDF